MAVVRGWSRGGDLRKHLGYSISCFGASLERRKEGRGGVWGESRFWFDGCGRISQQRNTVEGAGLGVVMLAGLPITKWAQRRKLRPQQGRRPQGHGGPWLLIYTLCNETTGDDHRTGITMAEKFGV